MPAVESLDRSAIAARLEAAVRDAGTFALQRFRAPMKSWMKAGASPVSEVDLAVDEMLRARLADLVPEAAWLSEESADDPVRLDAHRVWIVDPIDGTRGFIAGFDDWAVSAALIEGTRPVIAALFAPVTDAMLLAVAGQGATLNGQTTAAGDATSLKGSRVAGPKRRLEILASIEPHVELLPKVNSLALRIARVGTGAIDIAIAGPNSHDWDIAAADLIVHEAGALLSSLDNDQPVYNQPRPVHPALIAAAPTRHRCVLNVAREKRSVFA